MKISQSWIFSRSFQPMLNFIETLGTVVSKWCCSGASKKECFMFLCGCYVWQISWKSPPRTAQAQGFASLSWTSRFSLAEASREEPPSLLPKKILGSRNGHSNSESRLEKLQIFCLQLQLHQGLCVLWCMLPFLGTWMVDNVTFRSEMGVKTYAKSPSSIVFAKTIRNSPEYVGPPNHMSSLMATRKVWSISSSARQGTLFDTWRHIHLPSGYLT